MGYWLSYLEIIITLKLDNLHSHYPQLPLLHPLLFHISEKTIHANYSSYVKHHRHNSRNIREILRVVYSSIILALSMS